ncbi:hypothetical protein AAG906_027135 [Vitis piasezkii]
MSPPTPFILSFLFLFSISISSFTVHASVPNNSTFKYVNEGEFGPYIVEYDGNYRTLPIFASPFQFCFYNTTPNAYTLALRMATRRSESLFRWVWEANRGETDGNLVLAHDDGRVAWQTGTANKGVVGLQLLPNGNLVLYDSKVGRTLTFLRLDIDGNIRLYTYFDKVDWGAWEVTYTLFDRDSDEERSECQLPERCGKFGLCEDNQCVACPSPKGLMGWSKDCAPLKLSGCGVNDFHYYKLEGVDHFMSKYSKGMDP